MDKIDALITTAKECKQRGKVPFIYVRDSYIANGGVSLWKDIARVNNMWPGKIKVYRKYNLSEPPDIEFC